MGCNYYYPSSSLSLLEDELKTELYTKYSDFISERLSREETTFIQMEKPLNIKKINRYCLNIKTFSDYTNLPKDPTTIYYSYSKRCIPHLSLQKLNELFDDNTVECYQKKKKKNLLFTYVKTLNRHPINKDKQTLNSTYEQTAEYTTESEYYISKGKNKNNGTVY